MNTPFHKKFVKVAMDTDDIRLKAGSDAIAQDGGKSTQLDRFKVKDELLQDLHRHCHARVYGVKGERRKHVSWNLGFHDRASAQANPFRMLVAQ